MAEELLPEGQEKPSTETVQNFAKLLRAFGISSSNSPNKDTKRLYGVEALGEKWAARIGEDYGFSHGISLKIWRMPTEPQIDIIDQQDHVSNAIVRTYYQAHSLRVEDDLNDGFEWQLRGIYDPFSGQRCYANGERIPEGEPLMYGELNVSELIELYDQFKAQWSDPQIMKTTQETWK